MFVKSGLARERSGTRCRNGSIRCVDPTSASTPYDLHRFDVSAFARELKSKDCKNRPFFEKIEFLRGIKMN